jgi:hypothetical protein
MMLLMLLLFTALDCLPLWITSRWGKLLLRIVHEITGIELITERIGHGKKRGEKERAHHRFIYIRVRDSHPRLMSNSLTGQWTMRHRDPEVGHLPPLFIPCFGVLGRNSQPHGGSHVHLIMR